MWNGCKVLWDCSYVGVGVGGGVGVGVGVGGDGGGWGLRFPLLS